MVDALSFFMLKTRKIRTNKGLKMKRIMVITAAFLSLLVGGCSSGSKDLKSPCAGLEGSPCARRPVNAGMLQTSNVSLAIDPLTIRRQAL